MKTLPDGKMKKKNYWNIKIIKDQSQFQKEYYTLLYYILISTGAEASSLLRPADSLAVSYPREAMSSRVNLWAPAD